MANETTTTHGLTSGAAPPIVMCDEPGCTAPAVSAYSWDWGKSGNVCAKHQAHYTQIQSSLKRTCTFSPLAAMAPAPLLRTERTALIAAKLSAEAECDEVKARGVELYNQNADMARQLGSLRIRHTECEAQLKDAAVRVAQLEVKLVERENELAEAVTEIGRLKALVPREQPATTARRGGGKDVVETKGETSGEKK